MKKNVLIICSLLLLAGISEAQWSFNGTNIYNSNTGNVGIGTSSPGTLLEVGKNMISPEITIHNFGGAGGAAFAMIDNASGANWKFKATNTGGFKIRDHANGMDVFVIEPNSSANVLCINNAGNVGIKTTSPDATLSVANTSLVGITTTGSFQIGQSASYNLVFDNNEVQARNNGTGSNLYLQYWGGDISACASGGTANFFGPVGMSADLNVSGRIGVKTAPAYDLHLNSTDYSATYIATSYNGGTVANIVASGTTAGTWGLYAYATTLGYAGYFSGNVYCTGSYLPSDQKLKENIEPLENALDKVMQLEISTYNYKSGYAEMNLPTSRQYGFIAQNVESVFPELVKLNPAKEEEQPIEFKAVNYTGMIPILTEAIQEQQREIEARDARIDDLQKQLNDLKAQLLAIQQSR